MGFLRQYLSPSYPPYLDSSVVMRTVNVVIRLEASLYSRQYLRLEEDIANDLYVAIEDYDMLNRDTVREISTADLRCEK